MPSSPSLDLSGHDGIEATIVDNGVQVLSERVPGVRSATVGVWVRHGAVHDAEPVSGASHLLEHMVFKGTRNRSAHEIALSLEGLGGSLDAYTSREHTSYQARVLDEHLPLAMEVLADLTVTPLLRDEDLALERDETDRDDNGRLLRYVYADGVLVERQLIKDGFAEVVRYRSDDNYYEEFRALEEAAAEQGLGCHLTGIFDDGSYVR